MPDTGKTTEQQVADAILQRSDEVEIAGKTYKVAPPTTATLILVSEQASRLPAMPKPADPNQLIQSVLANARHYRALGDIAATLILGAKRIMEAKSEDKRKPAFAFWRKRKPATDERAELSRDILQSLSPSQLADLIVGRLATMEISSFFAITTSLAAANIIKPDEVED